MSWCKIGYLHLITKIILGTVFCLKRGSGTLDSTPAHVNGVLTTCAGIQISMTCNHGNTESGSTLWNFSPPINCSTAARHINPIISPYNSCPPFLLQDISDINVDSETLSSTIVAVGNSSLTGTIAECRDSSGLQFNIIGSIKLCIIGMEVNLSITDTVDGALIEWHLTSCEQCCATVTYKVIINITDNISNISQVIMTFGETQHTNVTGLTPNKMYRIQVKVYGTPCGNLTAEKNFKKTVNLLRETINCSILQCTTASLSTDFGQVIKKQALIIAVSACVMVTVVSAAICILGVLTAVAIKKWNFNKRGKNDTQSNESYKKSGTTLGIELFYANVSANTECQAEYNSNTCTDKHQVQYSEIQQRGDML